MKTNNLYNNNNLSHRCNFINPTRTMAISSYGEVFKIGARVGHEDKNAPNAVIESFDIDEESNEIIAFTDKGYCHIDFMFNLLSDDGIVIDNGDADVCGIESTRGVEEIRKERVSQIDKHGFTAELDARNHKDDTLMHAAEFCMYPTVFPWPNGLDIDFASRVILKDRIGQLAEAGAFIAAEIDRIAQLAYNNAKEYTSPVHLDIDNYEPETVQAYELSGEAIDDIMNTNLEKYGNILKEESNDNQRQETMRNNG